MTNKVTQETPTVEKHIEAIQNLADAVIELTEFDVPELEFNGKLLYEDPEKIIEIEAHEEFYAAYTEFFDIVTSVGKEDGLDEELQLKKPNHERHLEVTGTKYIDGERVVSLTAQMYGNGDINILAEYTIPGRGWETMYQGYCSDNNQPDKIDIGREVASAELSILSNELGSPAQVLDYWQTNRSDRKLYQSSWADVRGKSNQTVSDNVRAARDELSTDE